LREGVGKGGEEKGVGKEGGGRGGKGKGRERSAPPNKNSGYDFVGCQCSQVQLNTLAVSYLHHPPTPSRACRRQKIIKILLFLNLTHLPTSGSADSWTYKVVG